MGKGSSTIVVSERQALEFGEASSSWIKPCKRIWGGRRLSRCGRFVFIREHQAKGQSSKNPGGWMIQNYYRIVERLLDPGQAQVFNNLVFESMQAAIEEAEELVKEHDHKVTKLIEKYGNNNLKFKVDPHGPYNSGYRTKHQGEYYFITDRGGDGWSLSAESEDRVRVLLDFGVCRVWPTKKAAVKALSAVLHAEKAKVKLSDF